MLVSLLPFSFCFDRSTKYLVSFVSFSLFFNIFQNKFFCFPLIYYLVFWCSLLAEKSPCSKFHFDRSHSYADVSRFFFSTCWLSFHVSTPLCVPYWCSLSLCPPSSLLLSFLLLPNTSFKKKKKTFLSLLVIVAKPSCFFSVSFFSFPFLISLCETPSVRGFQWLPAERAQAWCQRCGTNRCGEVFVLVWTR